MKKRKLGSRLLTGVLSVLGFVGCDGTGGNEDMYGCPIVGFQVKGTVISEDAEPLKGIQVIVRTDWNNSAGGADTIYTDEKGEFKSHELSEVAIEKQEVYFNDVDGEKNGGAFKPDSILLQKMDKKQLEKGHGWYTGKFEFSTKVKLSKKEKNTEE